jgi:hypothetical protein
MHYIKQTMRTWTTSAVRLALSPCLLEISFTPKKAADNPASARGLLRPIALARP